MEVTDLHDWEIRSIHIDRESKTVSIGICFPPENRDIVLKLDGVRRFYASEMMLQNVILDVQIFSSDVESAYLVHCKKVLHLKDFPSTDGLQVIYIEPSVGIEVACYCESIEIDG